MANKSAFDLWMKEVDDAVDEKVGVSVFDLPDIDFLSMFEDGAKPKAAANAAIKNAGG